MYARSARSIPCAEPGFHGDVARLAGGVGEEHADGDLGAHRIVPGVELGKVLLYRIVKLQLALLVELHVGGCGAEALAERGHVEEGVHGHGQRGGGLAVQPGLTGQLAVPVGVLKDHVSVLPDEQRNSRRLVGDDGIVDETRDEAEVGGTGVGGGFGRERLGVAGTRAQEGQAEQGGGEGDRAGDGTGDGVGRLPAEG